MKNTLANIIINHVENCLVESTDLSSTIVSLCADSGIEENESWRVFTHQMRKDVIAIVIKHFQSKGYTVTSLSHNDQFMFKYNYNTVYSPENAQTLHAEVLRQKRLVTIPTTVNNCITYANEIIKRDAAKGHTATMIDFAPTEKDMREELLYHDKCRIYDQTWRLLEEAGYYVHSSRPHKALVIWDEEREAQYQKEYCAKAESEPAQPKKRKFFNWKH